MPIINGQINAQVPGSPQRLAPGAALQAIGPIIPVEIHVPDALVANLTANQQPIPAPVTGCALIDTGASSTCVEDSVMKQLGVNPIGTRNAAGVGGGSVHAIYPARLVFPPNIGTFAFSSVLGVHLTGQTQPGMPPMIALIGRDILAGGLLVYNGTTGSYSFALG